MRAFVRLLGMILLVILSANTTEAQFNYVARNGTVTITGAVGGGPMVIPPTINGLPVTSIATEAFYLSGVTSLTIPDTVTNIGDEAFGSCEGLTSLTIPDSVTTMGGAVFDSCHSLTNVVLSKRVPYISGSLLAGCDNLTSITIPEGVTNIGGFAFDRCSSLGQITIPVGVLYIGPYAFYSCESLVSVSIPDTVVIIDYFAFRDCWNLTDVIIPDSVTGIGNEAFDNCGLLDSVLLGSNVTSIGYAAFAGSTLSSINIPNGLTNIGVSAFAGTLLKTIAISSSVASIGSGALSGCSELESINVDVLNANYASVDGVLFNKDKTLIIQCPALKAGSYTVPSGVTQIETSAFSGCTGLTNLLISDTVIGIGDYAFDYCTSLTNITIGDGVLDLGTYAFSSCSNLVNVFCLGNAPTLGQQVFAGDNIATVYYLPGTTGWATTFGGRPTALWTLPDPLILNMSVGLQINQFGFTASWATNLSVVVEASADLGRPNWSPVATNALSVGTFYFSDPQWTNYPKRFYRVRSR